MKLSGPLALAGLLLATPAMAQDFQGQWYAQIAVPTGIVEHIVVISGRTYIANSTMQMQTAFGPATYFTSQSGEVMFNPPDNLRLIVLDWSPREYQGQPMSMPPNSNYKVLELTATRLTTLDNICAMSQPPEYCTVTYQRTP
jgi:hypothetical protein